MNAQAIMRRPVCRFMILPAVLLAGVWGGVRADTGIQLSISTGPAAGEATLTWSGLRAPYIVSRSTVASEVSLPANELGQTSSTSWIDSPPGEPLVFYHVQATCNPALDGDGDGFSQCDDCHDGDGSIFPGAVERCNGVDDDCDLLVDEEFDLDGDGFSFCPGDPLRTDCNDGDGNVHPGAMELCGATGMGNGIDENCDGYVDESCPPCDTNDPDGDGFSQCDGDCDPGDGDIYPGADEICDGRDTDCNMGTVENCGAAEPCNWPGNVDVCEPGLICNCTIDLAGTCTGSYVCSGFCNYSETDTVGEGCATGETCLLDLLRSANVHGCSQAPGEVGVLQGGVACNSNEECRSGRCERLCAGPGCGQAYCQDFCGSDAYCPDATARCRLARLASNIDGQCWPDSGPFLGSGAIGDACTGDTSCDHGFCANDGGNPICTAACCTDDDCPSGFACSLRGNQIDTSFLYEPPDAPSCTSDPDCPAGRVCFQSQCAWRLTETAPMCLSDMAGQRSLPAGSACTQDADCRSNFCEAGRNICIEVCCSDADCGAEQTCLLQYVQTTADRATQARVCVSTPTEQVLRHGGS